MFESRRGSWRHATVAVALAAGAAGGAPSLAQSSGDKWWTGYGNGADNSRYFASRQLDKSNVAGLEAAWTYPFGETGSSPIVVRGVINEYNTVAHRIAPPFTSIVKCDLNQPAIKWRVGFGDDPALATRGITGSAVRRRLLRIPDRSAGWRTRFLGSRPR